MSFPRFPRYKESSIPWASEVPAHWDLRRIKNLFERMDRPVGDEDGIVTAFRDGEVTLRANRRTEGFTNALQEAGYQGVRTGDLVIHAMDAFAGAIGVSNSNGKSTPVYSVCRPRAAAVSAAYYARLLRHVAVGGYITALAKGIRERSTEFRWAEAGVLEVPVPPPEEQRTIAAFLDRETAKTDALVAEQEKLIALLKEKRQAVISHAVTKGLNPHAPMKPSGIEWLGDVPAHWMVSRIKTVSEFATSGPRGWSDWISEEGSLFIQSGDLDDALAVDYYNAKRVSIDTTNAEARRTRMRDGDVLVCITGAKTGNVAVCEYVPDVAHVNQHLCLIRPKSNIVPMYLGLMLYSRIGQVQFELSQYGLKQGLSLEDVLDTVLLVPPIEEQRRLVDQVIQAIQTLDALSGSAERAVSLLTERRSALISAAVTGQIDVRRVT